MQFLKLSTAYTFQLGPFVDSTDGVTPEAALTIAATDVDVSKNGAAFADKTDATALTGTGDAQGYYDCVLDATDTGTLGKLEVRCYVSGALPVWREFMVLPAKVYDSLVSGSDNLEVDAIQWLGVAPLALSSQQVQAVVPTTQKVDVETIKTQAVAVTAAGTVTFPNATVASTTNITAGTVTLANGAHGGAAASLTLLSAVINNTGGSGLKIDGTTHGIEVTASAGPGIEVDGTTFGVQIDASAGAGAAFTGAGVGSDRYGLIATGADISHGMVGRGGSSGDGIVGLAGATTGNGIYGAGTGSGSGLMGYAYGTGCGVRGIGGLTSGHGAWFAAAATATSGDGIQGLGAGNGTGYGIYGYGGNAGGAGIRGQARANNDAGLECVKHGTGKDIDADQIDSILADTGTDGVVVASHTTAAKAEINAEVVDAINVDTYPEPAQGAPAATASLVAKLGYLYKGWRNKWTQTATEQKLFADNTTTVDQKATISDDLTTFTRGELGTGP